MLKCRCGKGGGKIQPIYESISIETHEKYYDFIKDVRNSIDLTKEGIDFLSTLNRENLIEIILIYSNLVKMYKDSL